MATTFIPVDVLKEHHRVLAEYRYEVRPVDRGYANRTLHINLDTMTIEERPVTQQMKEVFTGGRGFALWLAWNAVKDDTQWDDPENPLIIANGPICGTLSYAGVTLSPLTGLIVDSNVGGMFGPLLKGAGFDALEITGKADRDVIIVIDGEEGKVVIEQAWLEAPYAHLLAEILTEMYAEDENDKRSVSVVAAGPGAKHSRYGMLNFSWYDPKRKKVRYKQAARGGSGTVFVDKRIKAIVVRKKGWNTFSNNPAKPELIKKASRRINKEIWELDDKQNQMRKVGTPYLVSIMNGPCSPRACPTGAIMDANCPAPTVWTISSCAPVPSRGTGCWWTGRNTRTRPAWGRTWVSSTPWPCWKSTFTATPTASTPSPSAHPWPLSWNSTSGGC